MTKAALSGYGAAGPMTSNWPPGNPSACSARHIAGSQDTTVVLLTSAVTQAAASLRVAAWARSSAALSPALGVVTTSVRLDTANATAAAVMRTSTETTMPIRW